MNVELQFWRAMVGYAFARAHIERKRQRTRSELGASALEWAIISGILVTAALGIGIIVNKVIKSNSDKIQTP